VHRLRDHLKSLPFDGAPLGVGAHLYPSLDKDQHPFVEKAIHAFSQLVPTGNIEPQRLLLLSLIDGNAELGDRLAIVPTRLQCVEKAFEKDASFFVALFACFLYTLFTEKPLYPQKVP
jgi:hypothetical protein